MDTVSLGYDNPGVKIIESKKHTIAMFLEEAGEGIGETFAGGDGTLGFAFGAEG